MWNEGQRREGQFTTHTRRWDRKFPREADLRASSPPLLGEREREGQLKVTYKWEGVVEGMWWGCRQNYKTRGEAVQGRTCGENRMIIHSNTSTAHSSNIISVWFKHPVFSQQALTIGKHTFSHTHSFIQHQAHWEKKTAPLTQWIISCYSHIVASTSPHTNCSSRDYQNTLLIMGMQTKAMCVFLHA